MKRIGQLLVLAAIAASAITACRDDKADARLVSSSAIAAASSATAKPGTYDDWCEEHQVPESQCTECHPELVPAFKATGDWCEEHKMPESHCRKCKPDLKIVRPPKPT